MKPETGHKRDRPSMEEEVPRMYINEVKNPSDDMRTTHHVDVVRSKVSVDPFRRDRRGRTIEVNFL